MMHEKLTIREIANHWMELANKYPDEPISFRKAAKETLEIFGLEHPDANTDDYGQIVINTNVTYDEVTGELRDMKDEDYN